MEHIVTVAVTKALFNLDISQQLCIKNTFSFSAYVRGLAKSSGAVVRSGSNRQEGQAVAVIPQKADAKWLNQFIANAAKSSGEHRKTHKENGEAEREE